LKLQYDETLSNFGFNISLRRYSLTRKTIGVELVAEMKAMDPAARRKSVRLS